MIKIKLNFSWNLREIKSILCSDIVMKKTLTTKETKRTADDAFQFSQCIIDECGMCSEPETLVSIIASQANQVCLWKVDKFVAVKKS